jgi:hypothetical protein
MTKWRIGISSRLVRRDIEYRYNIDRREGEPHMYKLYMMMSYTEVLMLNYDSAGIEINKISYPRGLAFVGEKEPSFNAEKFTVYYHLHLAVSQRGIEQLQIYKGTHFISVTSPTEKDRF